MMNLFAWFEPANNIVPGEVLLSMLAITGVVLLIGAVVWAAGG